MKITQNQTFHKLTVIGDGQRSSDGHYQCQCRCECGHEFPVRPKYLIEGTTTQCRYCTRKNPPGRKHGMKWSREYTCWQQMKDRCLNPNSYMFSHCGGRGISIFPEWISDFSAFYRDVGPRPEGTSLDRINNDGNYEPGNVRWATRSEQARNKRNNRYLESHGKRLTIGDWAKSLGISQQSIYRHLKKGKSFDWIVAHFSDPSYENPCRSKDLTYEGVTQSILRWSQDLGVFPHSIRNHLNKGRPFEWIVKRLRDSKL